MLLPSDHETLLTVMLPLWNHVSKNWKKELLMPDLVKRL
jgi:hypothetical protein